MYKGTCPVCKQPLDSQKNDVVVCPVCGTPHHRHCYEKNGGCFYENIHSTGYTYREDPDFSSDEDKPGVCPACHTQNKTDTIFCVSCGTPLHMAQRVGQNNFSTPPNGFGKGLGLDYTPVQAFDESDTIDDIKTNDLVAFVGTNQSYYINHFKRFSSQHTKTSFNFPAFFAPSIFFLFRKMWVMSFFSILLTSIGVLPVFFEYFAVEGMVIPLFSSLFSSVEAAANFQYFLSIFTTVVNIFFGLFANYLYFQKAKRSIKKIRSCEKYQTLTNEEIRPIITKKGSISTVAVMVFTTSLFVLSTVLLFTMT